MLVLCRKVGEEVVLPTQGVTISVVQVSGKRVRLGIHAPPDTAIHRLETWQRIRASDPSSSGPQQAPQPVPDAPDDPCKRLSRSIKRRAGGRVRSLRVERLGRDLVVSGRVNSYYARQLVQAAVSEALATMGPNGHDDVRYELDVVL
jgi:carbon storage regulator